MERRIYLNNKIYKITYYIVFFIVLSIFSIFVSVLLDNVLSNNTDFFINGNLTVKNIIENYIYNDKPKKIFIIVEMIFILMLVYLYIQRSSFNNNVSKRQEVAKGIKTPVPVGERTIWNSDLYD